MTWDLPQNISAMFPKSKTNRLNSEDGYLVWALQMQNTFEYCGLLDIVKGTIKQPSQGDPTEAVWTKMNAAAQTFTIQCINSNLVMKISHL
jgi:hypothetical protein